MHPHRLWREEHSRVSLRPLQSATLVCLQTCDKEHTSMSCADKVTVDWPQWMNSAHTHCCPCLSPLTVVSVCVASQRSLPHSPFTLDFACSCIWHRVVKQPMSQSSEGSLLSHHMLLLLNSPGHALSTTVSTHSRPNLASQYADKEPACKDSSC